MSKSISLCMIVKDEERYIERCFRSVQGIVNEIIVVDTGSTDATIEIAKKYDAKVFDFVWNDDFSAARNFSLEKATGEYILVLDADEYIDPNSNIQESLELGKDYYINRIKNYSSELNVRYHEAVRLFKNNRGLKYFGKIHEHLNIQEQDYNFTYSSVLIHHVGYMGEVVKAKNKIDRNLKLLLDETKKNPTGYNFFNLAKQYKQMKEINKALDYFKKSYNLSKTNIYLKELLYHMGDCLRMLKRYDDAIHLLRDAIDVFPTYTDLHYMLAKVYEENGTLHEAEAAYLKCLELGEMEHTTTQGFGSYLAYFSVANIYIKMGDRLRAVEALYRCISLRKDFTDAVYLYIKVLTEVNIPNSEIQLFLDSIYPIKNAKEGVSLITALYSLRHPLLDEYLKKYGTQFNENIMAVAEQYAGKYNEAWSRWLNLDSLLKENIRDIIFISILRSDDSLLDSYREVINVNKREWNNLLLLVNRELPTKDYKLSDWFEGILVSILESLIMVNEYELFNYMSNWILAAPRSTQNKVAELLNDHKYFETDLRFRMN